MINQELLDYINQRLQQGSSEEQITGLLSASGWKEADIKEGFSAINSKNPVIASMQNTGAASNFANPASSILYAGFWLRFAAAFIDGFIINAAFALLGFVYFQFLSPQGNPLFSENTQNVINILFFITLWTIYFPFMESRGGATFGKKIVGIKVLCADGNPAGFLRSLGRNLAKMISVLILMIGFIMAGLTKKKQGLHDILAGCVVERAREISVGKIWATIISIIVISAGIIAISGVQFLFMLLGLSGANSHKQYFPEELPASQIQYDGDISFSTDEFTSLGAEEYDVYFSKPISGLDEKSNYFQSPHTYAGPALIALDDFWGLDIALPIIPNIENLDETTTQGHVIIDLHSVISKNGEEILYRDDAIEKSDPNILFFLKSRASSFEYLSARSQISFIPGAGLSDAKTVKGALSFKIPLDSMDSDNFYEKSYPFVINVTPKLRQAE